MFDWNLSTGVPASRLTIEHARELAGEIANSYLNAGHLPTDTLSKVAAAEDLTPPQIELVAAEANKLIHNTKYASVDEKYFAAEFPLADARAVIASLQLVGESKIAAEFVEPKITSTFDPFKAFGVQPEQLDKTASVKHELKASEQKLELYQQKLADAVFLAKQASAAAERAFIKEARQFVLNGDNSAERMQCLGMIYKAAEGRAEAKPALAKLAHLLQVEGKIESGHAKTASAFFLTKEADQKAPVALISPALLGKVQIVNGQHPLMICLKTVQSCSDREADLASRNSGVEDRLQTVRQKIREL